MQVSRRAALALAHPARTFWLIAVVVFLLDQVSKSLVRVWWSSAGPLDVLTERLVTPAFDPQHALPVLGEWLSIAYVRNTGAAFGLFPGYQPVFMATTVVVLVVVAGYWYRARPAEWPLVVALALIASGSVGNLIDRAVIGRVTDFFYVSIIDFPVFNIADSAIIVGAGILIAWLLFGPMPEEEHRSASGSDVQDGCEQADE